MGTLVIATGALLASGLLTMGVLAYGHRHAPRACIYCGHTPRTGSCPMCA